MPPLSRLVGRSLGLCVALVGAVAAWVGLFDPIVEGWGIHSFLHSNGILLSFAAGFAGVGFVIGGLNVAEGRGRTVAVVVGVVVALSAVALLPMEPKSTDGLLGFGFGALVLLLAAALTSPKAD